MSRRAVMRLHEFSNSIEGVEKFLATARSLGASSKSQLVYAVTLDGEPCLYIELPSAEPEPLRRKAPRKPDKAVQGRAKVSTGKVIILKKKRPK